MTKEQLRANLEKFSGIKAIIAEDRGKYITIELISPTNQVVTSCEFYYHNDQWKYGTYNSTKSGNFLNQFKPQQT